MSDTLNRVYRQIDCYQSVFKSKSNSNKSGKSAVDQTVRNIRRATRKIYSAEEKIGGVLEGLSREKSIADLCRREAIAQSMYYKWSREFLKAGK